jgi:hypothetical protein
MLRPCLRCQELTPKGSYCSSCEQLVHSPERMRGRPWMRRRSAVLTHAGFVCQRCDAAIAEEVHHVDGAVTNNTFANLIAVCRPCHLTLEREKRAA